MVKRRTPMNFNSKVMSYEIEKIYNIYLDVVALKTLESTLDVTTISKQERARQSLIHELIIVHHNERIKINFLISIYKPKILSVSKLKASQLTVRFIIFKNSNNLRCSQFFAILTKSKSCSMHSKSISDIMLDHFNLETEKGKNFQQQLAKWVSKDSEAN